jgi:SAM-dependent methyltransferase
MLQKGSPFRGNIENTEKGRLFARSLLVRFCGSGTNTNMLHYEWLTWHYMRKSIIGARRYVNGNLLDIGSGSQPYKKFLESAVSSYMGLDRPSTQTMVPNATAPDIYGDVNNLPFRNESFHTILMTQVLEHVPDPQQALSEASRILKQNGYLLLSVPFCEPLHGEPWDFFRYSPHGLRYLLDKAGLRIVLMEHQGYFGAAINKVVNRFLFRSPWKSTRLVRTLKLTIGAPLFLLCAFIMNCLGIWLDKIAKFEEFTPNYFLVAEKVDLSTQDIPREG